MPDIEQPDSLQRHTSVTHVIYGLYAAALISGITMIVAIIMNYIKRDDVVGTLLESHFRWQIRTFWFSLLWSLVGLATIVVGVGVLILVADCIWYIYRIAKGWLALNDGKPMYRQIAIQQ